MSFYITTAQEDSTMLILSVVSDGNDFNIMDYNSLHITFMLIKKRDFDHFKRMSLICIRIIENREWFHPPPDFRSKTFAYYETLIWRIEPEDSYV